MPGNVSGVIARRIAGKSDDAIDPVVEAAQRGAAGRWLAGDAIGTGTARAGVATATETSQELVQETSQALIEQHGKTGELDTASAFKQGAVGAMAGGIMGGGAHVAIGEGAVASAAEIEAMRLHQQQAQQALAADPTNPVLQNEVESARAAVAAATTTPAQRQQVADVAAAASATEIMGATDTDSAVDSFNQANQTSAALRTGAQIAEEAGAAIREMQGSFNPATAEFDTETTPAPAAVTPGGPTPAGVTADGAAAVASAAPTITPDGQTITPTPAAGRPLMASATIQAGVPPGTPNADAILQVANWQAGRDPVTNISRIVAGMAGDPNETQIPRPPGISPVVWESFVRDAQMETGIMVQHDGGIGRTVREGLREIATRGSRPGRMLAERLLATNNPYLNLTVGTANAGRGVVQHDGLGRVFSMAMNPNEATESSYIHESLHALTLSWLYTVPQNDPLYRELKQLMNQVKAEANSRGMAFYGTHPGNATTERSRMAEFLAEAFTRSTFQTFLDSIQVESGRTGWDTFVAWVGRLIGTTEPRQLSALDLALRINDNVLGQPSGMAAVMENQPTTTAEPVAEPTPTPAPAPEPIPVPVSAPADPYDTARQVLVDLGWEQNAIADFEARSDADLQGIIDTARRPAAADFARQIIARRAAEPVTGPRRRTHQSVVEAATRFIEIERQNGASQATIDRIILDTERTVNNGDIADVEASIQALEDANAHSEAEFMRALLDARDAREAATPAADHTQAVEDAAAAAGTTTPEPVGGAREAARSYHARMHGGIAANVTESQVDRVLNDFHLAGQSALEDMATNQSVWPESRLLAQNELDQRAGGAAPAAAPTPAAATPTPASQLTAAQRAARTRAQNRFMAYLPTAYGQYHGPTDDSNRQTRSETLRRAVTSTVTRLRRHPHARMDIERDRAVRGLVNNMGAEAAERWMHDRINGQFGTTPTININTGAGTFAPSAATSAATAAALDSFNPPPTDTDNTRLGIPTTPFASGPATPAAPATGSAPTQAALEAEVDAADASLRTITYATWQGRDLDRARLETMPESELQQALEYTTVTHQMPRTAALIRAIQNRNAFENGQPLPHPRFVAPVQTTVSSTPRWPGTAPVADRETDEYGGTPAAQQTAVPVTETVAPSVEQDYARRLERAKQSGALKRLADFWRTVISAPGQRMFEPGDIPLDDLRALVRANGNSLTQSHLTELKRRYNDAFHRKAVEWAAANGEPAPAREDIIIDLVGSGSSASIGLHGVGRGNPANPYLRARKADGTTPVGSASLGSHNTTTQLKNAPGSSDIAYRVAADMAYLRGGSSRASGSLLSNNNVRRQVQTMMHGLRLNNPESFSPMYGSGSNPSQSQQGQPEAYNSLSAEEKIGANILRTLHNAFINRENGRYLSKARALGNLVLNPDGQTYTAVGDPIDTRGFADGTTVTKQQLKDKLGELNSFDRSSSGGMGLELSLIHI